MPPTTATPARKAIAPSTTDSNSPVAVATAVRAEWGQQDTPRLSLQIIRHQTFYVRSGEGNMALVRPTLLPAATPALLAFGVELVELGSNVCYR